jgi:site-specific DNA-methyltransferase (adenine-specific)
MSERLYLNADCMNRKTGLPSYPDNYFDLAIVDPPYGIGQPKQSNLKGFPASESLEVRLQKNRLNSGGGKLKNRTLNKSNTQWDNSVPDPKYFRELLRVSKNAIVWGGNYFNLGPCRGILVWDKMQPWENFSQIEMAWTTLDCPAQLFQFDNRTGGKVHPTQKPEALYRWLVTKFAKQGMRLLDTHVGSASSLIAFEEMGFDYVAFEKDKDYYADSTARLEKFRRQGSLFTGREIFEASKQVSIFDNP